MNETIEPMADREPAPPHIAELAEACRRFVRKATQIDLDNTPDTLPVLDHYLSNSAKAAQDVRSLAAAAAGAYFGELVRAHFPCRWVAPPEQYAEWRIEFEKVFLHFNPVALAHEAIAGHEVFEGGAGFNVLERDEEAVRAGLEVLGVVAEEDYYRLSTRYEVLGTAVDRLVAANFTAIEKGLRFDPRAYRLALGEEEAREPS